MIIRINVMARKGEMSPTEQLLVVSHHLTKDKDHCTFCISVFKDAQGYYIKPQLGSMSCQFYHHCDHLHTSTSLLGDNDPQLLLADLNLV
jgi:hypothetical protein